MRLIFKCLLVILFAIPVFAVEAGETLIPFKIENQFEESAELKSETAWVLFSSDMHAARLLTQYLNNKENKTDLTKTLIVSDISKMPSLVSRMFAIPKMKKYNFKMALDKSGEVTKAWPRKESAITVMKLSDLKVESIQYLETEEAVVKFFAQAESK